MLTAAGNARGFLTKESDETGFVYFGARYYDPRIGRFITEDPSGMVDGPNVYLYCLNDPVNFVDMWGLCKENISVLEFLQISLDAIGVVDPTGLADTLNGLIYLTNGQWGYAGTSFLGVIPYFGDIAKAGKYTGQGFKAGQWLVHFEKHGANLGYKNSMEYLLGARNIIKGGREVKTFMRNNGNRLFYKEVTNEFVAVDKQFVIKTYFRPDKGATYWKTLTRGYE